MLGKMGVNFWSWLVFGAIYAISGNLWMAAFAHASTDYGLSPLVTNEPLIGLVFMAFLIYGAYMVKKVEHPLERNRVNG
jgi:membrane protease YdiL (CAAX protease family)